MEYRNINIEFNKNKRIGKVLYIVEGQSDEHNVIKRIFKEILGYDLISFVRGKKQPTQYISKDHPNSRVYVINTENSNIESIKRGKYLDDLFAKLIEEYEFDIDNCAIYYIFDRDPKSNKNIRFISSLIETLTNSRDIQVSYIRQGLFLLSYPSLESFILSNFETESYKNKFDLGKTIKCFLKDKGYKIYDVEEETLLAAVSELINSFEFMDLPKRDIDEFYKTNKEIFEFEEAVYEKDKEYHAISLLMISLIDLGIVQIHEE